MIIDCLKERLDRRLPVIDSTQRLMRGSEVNMSRIVEVHGFNR